MRNLHHLAARLYNAPLLVHPGVADTFGAALGAMLLGEQQTVVVVGADQALAGEGTAAEQHRRVDAFAGNVPQGSRFADKPYHLTEHGVAVLPVYGPLVQRAGQISADCTPMASYQRLRATYDRMQADGDVRGILLEFDTPGGEAAGMFALSQHMLASRGSKPVWGHANEGTYSAGFGLAAAADRLLAPQSGSVGSIGVVMLHLDQSQRDAKQGLVFTPIYAGARKVDFNSHAPLSRAALQVGQAEVDRLYDQFTTFVATARRMDLQAVRGTEAGIFAAADAKTLGLIDAVASFDETLAELTDTVRRAQTSSPTGSRLAATTPPKGKPTMADNQPAADQAAAIATARSEGHAAGIAEGATAERTRVGAILNHEAATSRSKLAHHLALGSDLSAAAAVSVLQAAAAESPAAAPTAAAPAPSPLAAAMAGVPNPPVGADAGNPSGASEADSPKSIAGNVIALLRQSKGVKA